MTKHAIQPGQAFFAVGPARVEVLSGQLDLFGAPVIPGQVIVVPAAKSLAGEPTTQAGAEVDVTLGTGGRVEWPAESTVPASWLKLPEVLQRLVGEGHASVPPPANPLVSIASALGGTTPNPSVGSATVAAMVGPTLGKSTAVQLTCNALVKQGIPVGLLDLDLGQQSGGPPATVSAMLVERPFLFATELEPFETRFVGAVSPVGPARGLLFQQAEDLLGILCQRVGAKGVVLVDTDGWVTPREGMIYKINLLHHLQPRVLAILAPQRLQRAIQTSFIFSRESGQPPAEVVVLDPPLDTYLVTRSHRDRSFRRLSQVHRRAQNPTSAVLDPSQVEFFRVIPSRARKYFGLTRPDELPAEQVLSWATRESWLTPGIVCGLFDAGRHFLGIGFLREQGQSESARPRVECPNEVPRERITRVQIGLAVQPQLGY